MKRREFLKLSLGVAAIALPLPAVGKKDYSTPPELALDGKTGEWRWGKGELLNITNTKSGDDGLYVVTDVARGQFTIEPANKPLEHYRKEISETKKHRHDYWNQGRRW